MRTKNTKGATMARHPRPHKAKSCKRTSLPSYAHKLPATTALPETTPDMISGGMATVATMGSDKDQLALCLRVLAEIPLAVILLSAQGHIIYANKAFSTLTKFPAPDLIGKDISSLVSQYPDAFCFHHLQEAFRANKPSHKKYRSQKINQDHYWERSNIVLVEVGQETHYLIGFFQDITLQVQSKELISHMAFYDLLTDLPNRIFFSGELESALKESCASGQKLAVVLLDLDRFKVINDTLGHTVGDQFIQHVAKRLRTHLAPNDTVARMGGDEFILLLPYIRHFHEVVAKLQLIKEVFREPFSSNNHILHINVSMGVSLFPEDGEDVHSLLKHADSALYEAKNSGRNHYKFFTNTLGSETTSDFTIEMSLRKALDQKHLRLYYQPQVSFQTGKIIGVEALLRWEDPEMGFIMPDRFIPLAEETGLIVPIGEWVLQEACAQAVSWQKMGLSPLKMAVNMSVRQFQEPELVEKVLAICQQTGLDPFLLELEITESLLLKDLNVIQMTLQWLKKKGIMISIDDFGTGYSSLKYLRRFPISTIKIDRSFIRDSQNNPDDAALVTTLCSIAHHLNLHIVAEGIENKEQYLFLKDLGCDAFQGFYFSAAVPADDISALLREGRCI
ncbi:EAL domain-containing protein [candidate division FCPU426 bacterium]|nr:EAL domain-containing protein [candidate division FCPU426 bacterium]